MPNYSVTATFEVDASQSSYAFPSRTPDANKAQLIVVAWFRAGSTPGITVSGCGLTWTEVAKAIETQDDTYGIAVFKGIGTPNQGVVTVAFGTSPWRCAGAAIEITDTDVTDPVAQSATSVTPGAGSLTITLPLAPAGDVMGFFNAKWPPMAGSGFTSLQSLAAGTSWDQIRALVEYATADQTIDSTFDHSGCVGIGIELKPRAAGQTLTAAESLALGDAIEKNSARSSSEFLAVLDALEKDTARSLSESLALHDGLTTVLGVFLTAALDEAIALTDSAGKMASIHILESVVIADAMLRLASKDMPDSIVLSDQRAAGFYKELLDQLKTTDERIADASREGFESLAFSDERVSSIGGTLAELLAAADALGKSGRKDIAEILGLQDKLHHAMAALIKEMLSLADSIAKFGDRQLAEVLSYNDVVTAALNADATHHVKSLVESLALADELWRAAQQVLAELVVVADALAKAHSITHADAIAMADYLLKSPAIACAEELIVSADISKLYNLSETERLSLNELLSKSTTITVEDVLHFTDSVIKDFVQLFGIVRLLSMIFRATSLGGVLVEISKVDVLRLGASAVTAVRLASQPAIYNVALQQSYLRSVNLIS